MVKELYEIFKDNFQLSQFKEGVVVEDCGKVDIGLAGYNIVVPFDKAPDLVDYYCNLFPTKENIIRAKYSGDESLKTLYIIPFAFQKTTITRMLLNKYGSASEVLRMEVTSEIEEDDFMSTLGDLEEDTALVTEEFEEFIAPETEQSNDDSSELYMKIEELSAKLDKAEAKVNTYIKEKAELEEEIDSIKVEAEKAKVKAEKIKSRLDSANEKLGQVEDLVVDEIVTPEDIEMAMDLFDKLGSNDLKIGIISMFNTFVDNDRKVLITHFLSELIESLEEEGVI